MSHHQIRRIEAAVTALWDAAVQTLDGEMRRAVLCACRALCRDVHASHGDGRLH